MPAFQIAKVVSELPTPLAPSTVYAVRVGVGFDLYITDITGSVAHSLNDPTGELITETTTPTTGDQFILLRGDVPYLALVDTLLGGGSGGSAEFPVEVTSPSLSQEVLVADNGVWKRTPIAELLNNIQPPLAPWDNWVETWFAYTTNPQPALAGAAISSGSSNNASPIVSFQDGYYHNGAMLSSSATVNSGYRWLGTHGAIRFGTIPLKARTILRHINETNVRTRCGFHDTTTFAEPLDGVWFDVENGVATGCSRSNATKYTTSTSFTMTMNAVYILDVDVNADATQAVFSVYNGITEELLWSDILTEGIPTLNTRMTNMGVISTVTTAISSNLVVIYSFGFGTENGFKHSRGIRWNTTVAPSAFAFADWTLTAATGGFDLDIVSLPAGGTSAITALNYRINGGAAVALTGLGTGVRNITGLSSALTGVQIQQVSAHGFSPWSDLKTVTPLGSAVAPSAFTIGMWTLTAITGGLRFGITSLPSDGGSTITALQYRLNGGVWTNLTGTGTGDRDITGLPTTLQTAEIRAVNAVGNGATSDSKSATPLASGGSPYIGEAFTSGSGSITAAVPAGVTAGDTLTAIAWSNLNTAPSTMAAPTGWTVEASATNPAELRGARVFTAPGNVSDLTFSATQLSGVLIIATSAPLRNVSFIGVDYSGPGASGANRATPSVDANSGDTGVSAYIQYDDGIAGAMVDPGTPQAGWTREFFKNDVAPWISVLSQTGLAAGPTGEVSHDANGGFSGRFLFTGSYGA